MKTTKTTKLLIILAMVFALASFGFAPATLAQYQRDYRYSDNNMQQLIKRLETRTDRFSKLLPNALDRSRLNGTSREDDVNRLVTDFEAATDQLKTNFTSRTSTQMDAQMVLQKGALINTFMRNQQLDYRTERSWTLVKTELDRLASAYNIARNWDTMQWPATNTGVTNYDAMLTGTFRLNTAISNNPRTVANNATRSLKYNQRQRVFDNLINRLTPPK